MAAYHPPKIWRRMKSTPESLFLSRRAFSGGSEQHAADIIRRGGAADLKASPSSFKVDEPLTPEKDVTNYNNFLWWDGKSDPAANSGDFKPSPWTIKVDGLVAKPEGIRSRRKLMAMPLEERTYRMRCVGHGPWLFPGSGFPWQAWRMVEPLGSAKYVAFETVVRRNRCRASRDISSPCLALCRGTAA